MNWFAGHDVDSGEQDLELSVVDLNVPEGHGLHMESIVDPVTLPLHGIRNDPGEQRVEQGVQKRLFPGWKYRAWHAVQTISLCAVAPTSSCSPGGQAVDTDLQAS